MADATEIPQPDSESGILHRAQAGDERAFELLMRAHYERTFRLAHAILRDEHEARDACQETWITVWRSLKSFRGDSKFSTWLHPIAVRRAVDHLRSRRRWYHRFLPMLTHADDVSAASEPAAPDNPQEEAGRNERRQYFEQALAGLPPRHHSVRS